MKVVKRIVNTKLQNNLKTNTDAYYHDRTLEFTASSDSTPTTFPTLNVNSLGEQTVGRTLTNEQMTILSTIELRAYTDTSLYDADTLINKAGDIMMSMGYVLITGPKTLNDFKPFCVMARFRRLVGTGDQL